MGNIPMSRLAYAVQERDKIGATFVAKRKQSQEHCDHLLLVNRDCSGMANKKYLQRLQEAPREATREYQSQRQTFEPGFFASHSPKVRDVF